MFWGLLETPVFVAINTVREFCEKYPDLAGNSPTSFEKYLVLLTTDMAGTWPQVCLKTPIFVAIKHSLK